MSASPKRSGMRQVILWCVILLACAAMYIYRQFIVDSFYYLTFQPSQEVSRLASRTTMKGWGKFYFMASRPQVESADAFSKDCQKSEPDSAILGCYQPDTKRIAVYNVTNDELDGIQEVTAAHEMLHAAYDRLSDADRQRIEPLLEQEFNDHAPAELRERIGYYDRVAPGTRVNELHSIIGTEVKTLPAELEEYYTRYFDNRQDIVAMNAQYKAKFTVLESQIDSLKRETTQERPQLDQAITEYESAVKQLNTDSETFNQRAEQGDFSSRESFDAQRQQLISRSNELQNRESVLKTRITAYNKKVDRLNALGEQTEKLNNSIDSTKAQ